MADKTEQQLTDIKKRLDAHDRAIATVSNAAQNLAGLKGMTEDLKALKTRVDALDAAVKALGIQMVLKKDLSTAKQLDANERDKEGKALELRMLAEARSQADKQKKEADAQIAKTKAEIQVQIDKAQAQADKNQAQIDKAVTESRIVTLEARLKAVEARLPK